MKELELEGPDWEAINWYLFEDVSLGIITIEQANQIAKKINDDVGLEELKLWVDELIKNNFEDSKVE